MRQRQDEACSTDINVRETERERERRHPALLHGDAQKLR